MIRTFLVDMIRHNLYFHFYIDIIILFRTVHNIPGCIENKCKIQFLVGIYTFF